MLLCKMPHASNPEAEETGPPKVGKKNLLQHCPPVGLLSLKHALTIKVGSSWGAWVAQSV